MRLRLPTLPQIGWRLPVVVAAGMVIGFTVGMCGIETRQPPKPAPLIEIVPVKPVPLIPLPNSRIINAPPPAKGETPIADKAGHIESTTSGKRAAHNESTARAKRPKPKAKSTIPRQARPESRQARFGFPTIALP